MLTARQGQREPQARRVLSVRRVLWVQREPQVLLVLLAQRALLAQRELSGLLVQGSPELQALIRPYRGQQVQSGLQALD